MDGMFIVFLPFLIFFVFLFVFALGNRTCPDCGAPLSAFQSPRTKTWRQWIEGGYLCQNCGCETTLAGERVAPGTGPRTRSVVWRVLLLTLAVGAAPVLIFFILSQSAMVPAPVAAPPVVAPSPDVAAPPVPPIAAPDR